MIALRNAKALVVDEANRDENDFENGSQVRARVGFFTKVEKTPEKEEHPSLTARFRIMQRISQVLIASGSNALPNPAVKTGRENDLEDKRPARITGVEWKRSSDPTRTLSAPFSDVADAHELLLIMEGSASALVSAQAAIEGISDPVMIVTGGSLNARGEQAAGVRKGVADEPLVLRLNLVVLDFSRIIVAAAPEAAAAGGTTP
jgi:hypothetical protein